MIVALDFHYLYCRSLQHLTREVTPTIGSFRKTHDQVKIKPYSGAGGSFGSDTARLSHLFTVVNHQYGGRTNLTERGRPDLGGQELGTSYGIATDSD